MKIVSSAIMQDNIIYTGRRHCNCSASMKGQGVKRKPRPDCVQGFVDETGKFYTRKEGLEVVRKNGQLTKPIIGSILTSEDLW